MRRTSPEERPRKNAGRWLKLAFIMPAALALSTGILPAHGAEPAVTIPWQEFQHLYAAQHAKPEAEQPLPRYSIEKAEFKLQPSGQQLTGTVKLSGHWLAGPPEPIALFANDLAITDLLVAKGGAMVSSTAGSAGSPGYRWLAQGDGPFELALAVAISANPSGQFAFAVPGALSNRLTVQTNGDEIVSGDGLIALGNNEYSFSSRNQLIFSVRKPATAPPLAVDIVSHFTLVAGRLQQKTWLSSDTTQHNITLQFDDRMAWLNNAAAELRENNQLRVPSLIAGKPLLLQFEKPWSEKPDARLNVALPHIIGNRGEQGLFAMGSPLSGQLISTTHTTLAAVPDSLTTSLLGTRRLQQAKNNAVDLQFQPYKAIEQPTLIVENVSFYSSYTDDGRQLSTLRLSVPKDYGPRLSIPPVADADIWALTVNGRSQPLYQNDDSGWVIPLPLTRSALVELSWVQQRERLGLHGKLPLQIPPLPALFRTACR